MLMMLAGSGLKGKNCSAADAHDARRLGAEGQRATRLMLMMRIGSGLKGEGQRG